MELVTIAAFQGMNNISPGVSEGVATPKRIVDALPMPDGKLKVRQGYEKIIAMADCSGLWKSHGTGRVYCIGDGSLCLVNLSTRTATPILTISMPAERIYCATDGLVDFIGNRFWLTAIEGGVARTMGQSIDDLQALAWQTTEEDGLVLFMKDSAGQETVIPHPGEFAHKPTPMDFLCIGHGRMWGARGKQALYSFPVVVEWWEDQANHFEFTADVTMIAHVAGGTFIGTETETIFLTGTDPAQMGSVTKQWLGVAKDSLVIAPKITDMPTDTPTWMNTEGNVVAGMPDGSIVELTRERVNATPESKGAAGVVSINGVQTLLYRIKE